MNQKIELHHLNATAEDLKGNQGIGRYVLLPGSDGRAQEIAKYISNLAVKSHPRGHHLYLGSIKHNEKEIDVAVISSGMGCPSMEIILHELFYLGAKRFLRVGTAGSLQPELVKVGDIVNVQGAVRDESTTTAYMPLAVPALASFECNLAILHAAKKLGISDKVKMGIAHCKSALYAREFGFGPEAEKNKAYLDVLEKSGVLVSEMETSALFIQSQLYNYQLMQKGLGRVLSGAILGAVSVKTDEFISSGKEKEMMDNMIKLALETIKVISDTELS